MTCWNPDLYGKAWTFACHAHQGQTLPGSDIPYSHHIGLVAMEAMAAITRNPGIQRPDLLMACSLLHDVMEDTPKTKEEVAALFGMDVASGVMALSKNKTLPTKQAQIQDSLRRIKKEPKEIWMVKLCDRIANLQPPPSHWSTEKAAAYREEAKTILQALKTADPYLADRLARKITAYKTFCAPLVSGINQP